MIMRRQAIYNGGWFDLDAVTKRYPEATYFDGRHQISRATGSQWEHQELYVTRRGVYVLHYWSQWQGTRDQWIRMTATQAAEWLTQNGYDAPAGALAEAQAQTEV